MQGIVGKNFVITGYKDGPNGTVDLRVEWVKQPPRPPEKLQRKARLRRLMQQFKRDELTPIAYNAACERVEADYKSR